MSNEMRLISKAGKTFYFATLWLSKSVRYDAARAYNFCRIVDDIADASPARPDRDAYLERVEYAVLRGDTSHELVHPLEPLLERFPEIQQPLADLVSACRQDQPTLIINDESDLEHYAHGVAGNVGLIMYPILGGTSHLGKRYAADLGIAMQYTNIARDVRGDLRNGRMYLPTSWLSGVTLSDSPELSTNNEATVVLAVKKLLTLADERYLRGLSGLSYLAPENRFAIRVAAQCYRAIGDRVIKDTQLSQRRAVVSMRHKIVIACKSALQGQTLHPTPPHLDTAPVITSVRPRTQPHIRYKTGAG